MSLPIEYKAILRHSDGETEIDLSEKFWRERAEMKTLRMFTLKPTKAGSLPMLSVDLSPLPGGEPRRLIYFSRVFGDSVHGDRFRFYCLGWQATVEGRSVQSKSWVYPGGAVVAADEPPFIDELLAS